MGLFNQNKLYMYFRTQMDSLDVGLVPKDICDKQQYTIKQIVNNSLELKTSVWTNNNSYSRPIYYFGRISSNQRFRQYGIDFNWNSCIMIPESKHLKNVSSQLMIYTVMDKDFKFTYTKFG